MGKKSCGASSESTSAIRARSPSSAGTANLSTLPICRSCAPAGRPTLNALLLSEIVAKWQATEAFVEFVGPDDGRAEAALIAASGLLREARLSAPTLV